MSFILPPNVPPSLAAGNIAAFAGLTLKVHDQFTDANGTALGAHSIAPVNLPAAAWSIVQGGFDIQGNRCNATGPSSRARCASGAADGAAEIVINAVAGDTGRHGLVMRCSDANNFWFACVVANSNQFEITERNAGTVTVRASTGVTITGGVDYLIRAVFTGQSIVATINNANQISYGSAALNATVAFHGIANGAAGADLDDFKVYG